LWARERAAGVEQTEGPADLLSEQAAKGDRLADREILE
jgi:hypothetical protein